MISLIVLCILGVSSVHASISSAHLCDEVASLDCNLNYIPGERDETVCGSDGNTYSNFCFYSQARCATPTTHIASVGACSTVIKTTPTTTAAPVTTTPVSTMQPTTTTTTSAPTTVDHLREVFCASKDSVVCTPDLDPICGSDKNFYLNQCEFSKATCDNSGMTVKDISFCTGGAGK